MQQFAVASVKPRSIAWLVRLEEWDRFEQIIKYNCAMVGGYFNVIVPLTNQDTISEEYQRFLVAYDPDLVILAPGMAPNQLSFISAHLHPFSIVSWEYVSGIAMLDPWGGGTGINATLGASMTLLKKDKPAVLTFVAIADEVQPDMSRLALVACGDVNPREPMWEVWDGDISLDAIGHREIFLTHLLKSEDDQLKAQTHVDDDQEIVLAPNRYQLANIILDEHKFPLSNPINILKTCFRMQRYPAIYRSFIGLTAEHKQIGTPERIVTNVEKRPPAIVILVSDSFNMGEAALFWNLRAGGIYVGWLPFAELESNIDEIAKWLDSDYIGSLFLDTGTVVAFSTIEKDFTRLQTIVNDRMNKQPNSIPTWDIILQCDLVFYNYVKPYLRQERVMIAKNETEYTFIPKLPQNHFSGEYVVSLKWNGLMLPQNNMLVHNLISSKKLKTFFFIRNSKHGRIHTEIAMPRFRITNDRFLEIQINSEEPIIFTRPSPEHVVETLFTSAGFSRIELSNTARYHKIFIERSGSLEEAARYLATPTYRELFEVLSDNGNKSRPGWILDYPSKRRALHHLYLRNLLRKSTPSETKKYFDTISDELPEEAIQLLEKNLLERGFLLTCTTCSFKSWYPAEHVGQTFECSRCFQSQVYRTNPLWLYKLPEVIFQGFEDNMQVPLLALSYLKGTSRHYFEWIPDSDVYWAENGEEKHGNVDIIAITDGKLYMGEAKSNDEIKPDQFSFYEHISRRVTVDGIVFATSKPQWAKGTLRRIEQLKTWFEGEILVLTEKDLYPNTQAFP